MQYGSDQPDADVFPSGLAPFIRLAPYGTASEQTMRSVADGIFRFVPDFVSKLDWARRTYNARSETLDTKRTYRREWREGRRCIIPAEAIYEPRYEVEGEPSVRWRISLATGEPMGIAGIYSTWTNPEGEMMFGMSMLTVNTDDHPFMRQFHAPGDEKRMVVILAPEDYDGWLRCPVAEAKARYCKQWHGPMTGKPAPLPGRAQKPKPVPVPKVPKPAQEDPNLSLF